MDDNMAGINQNLAGGDQGRLNRMFIKCFDVSRSSQMLSTIKGIDSLSPLSLASANSAQTCNWQDINSA